MEYSFSSDSLSLGDMRGSLGRRSHHAVNAAVFSSGVQGVGGANSSSIRSLEGQSNSLQAFRKALQLAMSTISQAIHYLPFLPIKPSFFHADRYPYHLMAGW